MASFTTDELRSMFVWGAIGGALPTLGKIAGTYGANFDAPAPRVLGVLIALALYGTIGSIIARAIGNPDVKQALFAGIAAPAIVISVLTGASDSQSLHPGPQGHSAGLFSPAFAQAPPVNPQGTRSIVIRPQIVGSYPVGGAIEVSAKSGNRLTQVGTVSLNPSSAPTTLRIPSGPTTLGIHQRGGGDPSGGGQSARRAGEGHADDVGHARPEMGPGRPASTRRRQARGGCRELIAAKRRVRRAPAMGAETRWSVPVGD